MVTYSDDIESFSTLLIRCKTWMCDTGNGEE